MRKSNLLLALLILASFLHGQTDSIDTDSTTVSNEIENTSTESVPISETVMDTIDTPDTIDTALEETKTTLGDSLAEGGEIEYSVITPSPVRIVGLMYDGPLYYWSNDNLVNIGFEQNSYLSFEDPILLAVKAKDCTDIVCHLLESDTSYADYVVVSSIDDPVVQIYEIATRANIIETNKVEALALFENYLKENGYQNLFMTAAVHETVPDLDADLEMNLDLRRAQFLQLRQSKFRSMKELFANPANFARTFESHTSWNVFPDFKMNIHNSLLTPGWYKEWWTTGMVMTDAQKNDYLGTIIDKDIVLKIQPEFQSIFGFRIGQFGFNLSGVSFFKLVMPGNILGKSIPILPIEDIALDQPISNSGLEFEAIPFGLKTSLSYAHPLETEYGNLKVGVNLNFYKASGYIHMVSDDFTVILAPDSVHVTATGEGWVTKGGIQGHLDDLNTDNLEFSETLSDITMGIDLGLILDLRERLHQEVEIQLSLRNLGAQYKWSNLSHETWTFEQHSPGVFTAVDSIEQYQVTETTVLGTQAEYSVNIPTVLNIRGFYQPVHNVLLGAGIEKAFTDITRFGYSPDLEISFQANYYPVRWLDLNYYLAPRYGDPTHTFGTGLHIGFLDTGLSLSFLNGLNSNAKGVGFTFYSSMHF
ncbi:MAG: hypothetical protein K9N35_06480 [Candidatus Marinimicrobia bacterium]|nr:hypothetical protein [Candidatus Neomarinimicrobiota bacterium]